MKLSLQYCGTQDRGANESSALACPVLSQVNKTHASKQAHSLGLRVTGVQHQGELSHPNA